MEQLTAWLTTDTLHSVMLWFITHHMSTNESRNGDWFSIESSCNHRSHSSATISIMWAVAVVSVSHVCTTIRPKFLWSKGGHGPFTMHNNLCVSCAQKGEAAAEESAQVLTQKNWKSPSTHPDWAWNETQALAAYIVSLDNKHNMLMTEHTSLPRPCQSLGSKCAFIMIERKCPCTACLYIQQCNWILQLL